jgi:hypothetical protein
MVDVAGHDEFEELAAGHALNALEPADELRFLDHLAGCGDCRRSLAEFSEIAAGLALTSSDDADSAPPADLWSAIRAEIDDDALAPVAVPSGGGRPRRRQVWLSAAAAVALVAAGVIGWQVAGSGSPHRDSVQSALANCRGTTGCRVVHLSNSSNTNESAFLMITGKDVRVATASLPAIDANRERYVLWQMPQDGRPIGVVAFPLTGKHAATVAHGTLTQDYDNTTAFAISREQGTSIPAMPSPPVVIGSATST